MEIAKYDCIYTTHTTQELWPSIRQITIDLGLRHLFLPYESRDGRWHFKVGGSIEQHNEFSRRWAELEPKEEIKKVSFFDKVKQFLNKI